MTIEMLAAFSLSIIPKLVSTYSFIHIFDAISYTNKGINSFTTYKLSDGEFCSIKSLGISKFHITLVLLSRACILAQ